MSAAPTAITGATSTSSSAARPRRRPGFAGAPRITTVCRSWTSRTAIPIPSPVHESWRCHGWPARAPCWPARWFLRLPRRWSSHRTDPRSAPSRTAPSRAIPLSDRAVRRGERYDRSGSPTGNLDVVSDEIRMLPDRYHDAIEHWRQHNFPDYPKLAEVWPKFFPKDDAFCLCAKAAGDIPAEIEIGDDIGKPKALQPNELA